MLEMSWPRSPSNQMLPYLSLHFSAARCKGVCLPVYSGPGPGETDALARAGVSGELALWCPLTQQKTSFPARLAAHDPSRGI